MPPHPGEGLGADSAAVSEDDVDGAVADLAEARNASDCALIVLLREYDVGHENAVLVLRSLSIPALWLVRRVSRDFRRWSTAALRGRRQPLVLGGMINPDPCASHADQVTIIPAVGRAARTLSDAWG